MGHFDLADSNRCSDMNQYNLQQNTVVPSEDMEGFVSISEKMEPVVCPKPRRVGILSNNHIRPTWLHFSQMAEVADSKAGSELLEIFLMKEEYGTGKSVVPLSSSPPFFFGSPPSRAANPLVQDARFGDEKLTTNPAYHTSSPSGFSNPSSSSRKGGCVRMKHGLKAAAVRVEGFDCLNRDRQNSSIPAVA